MSDFGDRIGPSQRRLHARKRTAHIGLLLFLGGMADISAQTTVSLADYSLEDLMNVKITSVSRKEENLSDAAAAIFVLSQDDLRRSGATTVADALRLVPGLQVASIDSGTWAISGRGFNSLFANKLLVMVDGRTVYTPLFSGVYWDAQQVFLDDVDRIEVIRGPGATIWGANAVNGVINIVSKSARETQGGLLYGGGGDVHQALGGARYGGRLGPETYYRVYSVYQRNDNFTQSDGRSASDAWDLGKGGMRVDRYTRNEGQLTWNGNAYAGNLNDQSGDLNGVNTLGRWMQPLAERSRYEIQGWFDHTHRNDVLAETSLDTAELSALHAFGMGERHEVIWGLGERLTDARLHQANSPTVAIADDRVRLNLLSAFVQDEIHVIPERLAFTLGTKIEHNDFTGIEVQPGARLAFKPRPNQTVWTAVSRAVRTPSIVEGRRFITFASGAPVTGPDGGMYVPTYTGNTQLDAEVLNAYELGYRIQPTPRTSLDLATFYNDYRELAAQQPTGRFIPGEPVGVLTTESVNALIGESYGGEVVVTVAATDSWRLSATYALLLLQVAGDPAATADALEANAPTHQAVLRSAVDVTRHVSWDAQLRYVDNVQEVPAYTTMDMHVSWCPSDRLDLSLVGQNLLEDHHPEQVNAIGPPIIEVPRGVYGRVTWQF